MIPELGHFALTLALSVALVQAVVTERRFASGAALGPKHVRGVEPHHANLAAAAPPVIPVS